MFLATGDIEVLNLDYKLSASRTAAGRLFRTAGLATKKAFVAKFRSCLWNSVVAAGRRAETSPCWITVAHLHRIGEVFWAAACVDCEHHQCHLELDSVHNAASVAHSGLGVCGHAATIPEVDVRRRSRPVVKEL